MRIDLGTKPTGEELRDSARQVVYLEMVKAFRGKSHLEAGTALSIEIQYDSSERGVLTKTPVTYVTRSRQTLDEAAIELANEWCRLVGIELQFVIEEEPEITDVL